MKKIAINGFGRIGRLVFRVAIERGDLEVVAVNDLTDAETLAHLLKYDSIHGILKDVKCEGNDLVVRGKRIKVLAEKDPKQLPWGDLGIDCVIESTGRFTDKSKAEAHLEAGAKKVVISAPATGDLKTVVMGINDDSLDNSDAIVSNASCTTNCLAPMVKILDDLAGVEHGLMTTVHAYTADQRLQDAPHKDLRRARASALSMIPTSTGAAKAVGLVLPHLNKKLNGLAVRVPTPDGSLTDFVATVKKKVSVEEVNEAYKKASEARFKGILEYQDEPIVSIDIVGNSHSCIFDSKLTLVQENTVKVMGWYDNEWGYSNRVVDLIGKLKY